MIIRFLLILIGLLATGLAIIGVVLPGLPTTPFLLIALWAFARSSTHLHAWLTRIPILKFALVEAERFERTRSMHIKVKIFALLMLWTSVILTTFVFTSEHFFVIASIFILAFVATIFFLWVRTDWE